MTAAPTREVTSPGRGEPGHVIGDIEILRGVAICMVFVEHLPVNLLWWKSTLFRFSDEVWHGAMGVDLFFVISGFVIARGLLPDLRCAASADDVSRTLRVFFVRRVFRLLPSALVWLGIPLWLSYHYGIESEFGDYDHNSQMSEFALFSVADFYVAATQDIAVLHNHFYGPSVVYWSLSLEEQFYLLLPILVLVSRARLLVLLVGALVYQFAVPFTPLTNFIRPGALAMGVLLAIVAQQPWYAAIRPTLLGRSAALRGALLAGCLVLLGFLGVQSTSWKLGLVALTSGLLVFVASFNHDCIWPERSTARIMKWVGSRSYSLYLTHMTALCGTRQIIHYLYGWAPPHSRRLEAVAVCAAIVLALALAEATYRLIEQPCKIYGRRLAAQIGMAGSGAREMPSSIN